MAQSKLNRLDKIVSELTSVSRVDAKKYIRRGKVSVNGVVETSPDKKADFEGSTVIIDGTEYIYSEFIYIMMNKPAGYVCTSADDPESVLNLLPDGLFRRNLSTVGRLDKDTTGLLLITNDGDFAHKIISPKSKIAKHYVAQLAEPLSVQSAQMLLDGVTLKDGEFVSALSVDVTDDSRKCVDIAICEGKYHQIKRMFAAVGNCVESLSRISIGHLVLDNSTEIGKIQLLTPQTVKKFFM